MYINPYHVTVNPLVTLSYTATSGLYCTDPITLTALGNFTTLDWGIGNSQSGTNPTTVNPVVNTVYTITADGPPGACMNIQTLAINAPTNCCTSPSLPVFTLTSLGSSTTLTGPKLMSSDYTVQAGTSLILFQGEFIFTQNARIVVENNASLWIAGSHLYSCGGNLWKGILVKDGGQMFSYASGGNGSLIEDAETAIDFVNQATTTVNPANIGNTVFNKNYIDISINNYASAANNYTNAFMFNDVVFTCRNFSFTNVSWPSVSTASTGLRYAASPTTGLAPPYNLLNAPIVNLKPPYGNRRSFMAININSVGITTGTSYPTAFLGLDLTPGSGADFTLFDAHENFINALNSNVRITNCVFQNTQTFSVNNSPSVGAAVNQSTSIIHNFKLDMAAANFNTGNRFYNCHKAITGDNIFDFRLEKAIIRSTQSNTALTNASFQSVGQQGVFINTKQADYYIIENNEFTNLETGVAINFYSGPVNANMGIAYNANWTSWPQTSYVNKVSVSNNTICPELNTAFSGSTNRFVKNGVVITSPHSHYIFTACGCNTVQVNNNLMYRVINGVRIDALNSYTMSCRNSGIGKAIANNTITVEEDFGGASQRGIEFTNSQSYPAILQKVQTIESNLLSVYGSSTVINNQNITLMHLFNNGALSGSSGVYPTPYVLCNDLSNAYNGFVFNNANQPASWNGNIMQNLKRVMTLESNGVIGVQGNSVNPTGNIWSTSSNWTGTNYGIWTNASIATLSPLYVNTTTATYNPPNLSGFPAFLSYTTGGIFSATGTYTCGVNNFSQTTAPLPNPVNYEYEELLYIANTSAYRFLAVNDSLLQNVPDLLDFYTLLQGTSIDKFTQTELNINNGQLWVAQGILDAMETTGLLAPELNYYNFYQLYLKYKNNPNAFSPDDIVSLKTIADLCPNENGQAVYQARALYQLATKKVYQLTNSCNLQGKFEIEEDKAKNTEPIKPWDVEMFPNPAQNQLNLVTKNESEVLTICIKDLTGRLILNSSVKSNGFIATLELPLVNGAYLISINNSINETVTKKLLIAK